MHDCSHHLASSLNPRKVIKILGFVHFERLYKFYYFSGSLAFLKRLLDTVLLCPQAGKTLGSPPSSRPPTLLQSNMYSPPTAPPICTACCWRAPATICSSLLFILQFKFYAYICVSVYAHGFSHFPQYFQLSLLLLLNSVSFALVFSPL